MFVYPEGALSDLTVIFLVISLAGFYWSITKSLLIEFTNNNEQLDLAVSDLHRANNAIIALQYSLLGEFNQEQELQCPDICSDSDSD